MEKDGDLVVWAGKASTKTWWRNFREPRAATVRLRGREVAVTVRTVEDPAARAEYAQRYRERYPRATPDGRPRFFGARPQPSPEELDRALEDIVVLIMEPVREPAAN